MISNYVSWVEPFGLDHHLTRGSHFVLPPGPPSP